MEQSEPFTKLLLVVIVFPPNSTAVGIEMQIDSSAQLNNIMRDSFGDICLLSGEHILLYLKKT